MNDWLNPLLHWSALAIAAALVILVVTAPWLATSDSSPAGLPLALQLFARDRALRRIAIAVALGLIVTARVFFRKSAGPSPN